MNKPALALAALAVAAALPAHALGTGDLLFTSFNADEDGWAMVALADIAADSTVFFTDNEWTGSAFNTGESYHTWATGASTITAGTVVRFASIDKTSLSASVGTLARGTVSGSSNYGISADNETIYAFLGTSLTSTPTTFLGAITSGAFGTAASGSLDNTGLTVGNGAIQLSTGTDFAQYTGARSGLASFAGYKPLVSDIANWEDRGSGSFATVTPDVGGFAVTAVPEPDTYALLLAGIAAVGFVARRRRG